MNSIAYLYKLEGCEACKKASQLLISQGYEVKELFVDDPLREIGNKIFFKDGLIHVPLIVIPNKGIYMTNTNNELLQIMNLRKQTNG